MIGPAPAELLRCPGCQLGGLWPAVGVLPVRAGVTWTDGYSYFAGHGPAPALVACPRCRLVHTPCVEGLAAPPPVAAPRPPPPRLVLVTFGPDEQALLGVLRRHCSGSPAQLATLRRSLPGPVPLRAEKEGNDQHRWAALNQARRELRAIGAEVRFDPPVEQHQHLGDAAVPPATQALARELRGAGAFDLPPLRECLAHADRLAAAEASDAAEELAIRQQAFWESGHDARRDDDPELAPVTEGAAPPAGGAPALERLVQLARASAEAGDHLLAAEALRRLGRFEEAIALASPYEGSEWEHELPVVRVLELARAGRTGLAIAFRWVA